MSEQPTPHPDPTPEVGSPVAAGEASPAAPGEVSAAKKRLARLVVQFTLVRIALVLVLTGIIEGVSVLAGASIPLVVAFLIGVVAALPLSLVLFNGLRKRVNEAIVVVDARRRAEKEQLHARLGDGDRDPRDRA